MSSTPRDTLAVIGAINVDLVVSGARLPTAGETVVGGRFSQHQGGKGGNQAVAAARALGTHGRIAMIGAVGPDAFGEPARELLAIEGVDVTHVAIDRSAATGVALITVDAKGENQIAVAPGANAGLTPTAATAALDRLGGGVGVVLASLEVPLAAVEAAARWAYERDLTFVLNPAPARTEAHDLLPYTRVVTPNAGELAILAAQAEEPRGGAKRLASAYEQLTVVVTLGDEGALASGPGGEMKVAAPKTRAVDATGAGDTLNGVLAAGLLEGLDLADALRRAVRAAALSVGVAGAREGMPSREAIEAATY
ncbi:MAG: ribokinase [Actinomycetota bacterium]|nr:ribokinase [Actinomycetota bacterium]MDH5313930.1 ribokinase [Actinomycetota bacterium]